MKPSSFLLSLHFLLGIGLFIGCDPHREPRVYNAPKEDTVFVVQPPAGQRPMGGMAGGMPPMSGGAAVPMAEKRILGAIFPLNGAGYFLKITDSIDRIEKIQTPFPDIVAQFKTDAESGKPEFPLPEGWKMQPGDAFAEAKVSIPIPDSDKPAVMTISKLNAPADEADWPEYVLMQMNRWNGQVSHQEQNLEDMLASLQPISREGSNIPAYIFDKNGSHTATKGAATKGPTEGAEIDAPSSATTPSSATPPVATTPLSETANKEIPNDAIHAGLGAPSSGGMNHGAGEAFDASKLQYDVPEGWEKQPDRAFRLATFKVPGTDGDVDGEVVLSQALDNPIENSKMWAEQILKTDDPSILGPKAEAIVNGAETVPAGKREAKLYTIRGEDEPSGIVLEIAVVPMDHPEIAMFVKLRSSQRMAEQQKTNLLRFVDSLRWE